MKIELARKYGSCFGVIRAIKIAEEAGNSYTYGPLIHNNQEINRLKLNFNVKLENDLSNFNKKDKVIVRTHGIEKQELQMLKDKNINVIDATCPFVTKPQEIVKEMSKLNYDVVIFGDKEHPEIKGVKSYAVNNAFVVLKPEELESITLKEKIAVIAQTTKRVDDFLKITNYLIKKYREIRVFNTICNATFDNQEAAAELSKKADVMIVMGGRNSSNTKQLLNICLDNCPDSYLVESEDDLQVKWFNNKKLCGVTAGASTPEWIIEKIINEIKILENKNKLIN
jgi:4-hydroxy-3-methylbut-2-enyl diphosphate reductase